MARISEKSNKKLSSIIWTWIVIGVIAAVVITATVLGIIYLVEQSNNNSNDVTYEEKYENYEDLIISFEELESILNPHTPDKDLLGNNHKFYVFIYSPNYEDETNKSEELESVIKSTCKELQGSTDGEMIYIVNVLAEENENFSLSNSAYLSSLSTLKYPTLLVISEDVNNPEADSELAIVKTLTTITNIKGELQDYYE